MYDVVIVFPDLPTPLVAIEGIEDKDEAHCRAIVVAEAWGLDDPECPMVLIQPSKALAAPTLHQS